MRRIIIESIPTMKEGGLTNADLLTGNYAAQSPNPNVEVEGGEHTKNSQTGQVQEVVGKKHVDGGEKVNLPNKSKVLSDYTKIGGQNTKIFNEMFDIKSKASDTFATVLDKFNTKIGVKKLEDEEKELLDKIEKNSKTSDKTTKQVNDDFLSQELADVNKKKEALNKLKAQAFESIFAEQEKIPKKGDGTQILNKAGNPIKQEGGQAGQPDPQQIIQAYAQMAGQDPDQIMQQLQGMQPDQQQQAIQQMLSALQQGQQGQQGEQTEGQEQPQMKYGGMYEKLPYQQEAVDPYKGVYNPLFDEKKMILQHAAGKGYGQNLGTQEQQTFAEMQRILPSLYKSNIQGQNVSSPEVGGAYQLGYNEHAAQVKADAAKVYGVDSEQYKQLAADVDANIFTPLDIKEGKNYNVRGLDKKVGDYTTTRPNFQLSVIPREELAALNKQGINTASQLKEKNPELFNKYVGSKNLTSDFWLGAVDPGAAPQETPAGTTPQPIHRDLVKNVMYDKGMPYVMPPSAPIAPYLQQVNLSRLESQKGSVENQLQASENARQAAMAATKGLPPAQAAAMMANYLSTSGQQDTSGIANQEVQDLQNKARVEQYNAGQADKEQLLNEQLKKQYEREAFGTLNVNEQNWRNYYDANQANQKEISDEIERRNIMNMGLTNYQLNGSGGFDFVNKSPFAEQAGKDPILNAFHKSLPEDQRIVFEKAYAENPEKALATLEAYKAKRASSNVIKPNKA